MESNVKRTNAEETLSTMATIVLILGLLSTIATFFATCLIWEEQIFGRTEVRFVWQGIPITFYALMATLIGWSVLSILVEIAMNIRNLKVTDSHSWEKDFVVLVTLDQKERAKELLYREVLLSSQFSDIFKGASETYRQSVIESMNKKYASFLAAIGETSFQFDGTSGIYNIFKSR